MVSERGIFSRASDGAMPGVVAGLTVGASRAYLSSRADAEQTAAALAKAASSARPPRLPTHPLFVVAATTAAYATLGGVYTGTEAIAEGLREKDDLWNRVIGAGTAGSLVGFKTGKIGMSIGGAFTFAALALSVSLLGGTIGIDEDRARERREAIYKV